MNIGSVEPRNGGSNNAGGELFVDRSQGLNRDGLSPSRDDAGSSHGLTKIHEGSPPVKSLSEPKAGKKTSPGAEKNKDTVAKKKRRSKKRWKKAPGKPNRPLSAYNLFFAHQRAEILGDSAPTPEQEELKKRIHCKTHGKIGFAEMARTIGAKWKAIDPEQKKVFEDMAAKEKERYQKELAVWKETQKKKPSNTDDIGMVMSSSLNATNAANMGMNPMAMNMNPMAMNPMAMLSMQAMQSSNKGQSDSMRLLLESNMNRRNISRLQPGPQADYIRHMQELPVDQAALLGMSQRQMMLDASQSGQTAPQQQQQQQNQPYPTAAEASADSANTLLNHFQQGPAENSAQQDMERQLFDDFVTMRRLQQRFIASGGIMGGGGMNNPMNMSMNAAAAMNMSTSGMMGGMGGAGGMMNSMSGMGNVGGGMMNNMSMGGMSNMSMGGGVGMGGMSNMSMRGAGGMGNSMNMNNFMNNN